MGSCSRRPRSSPPAAPAAPTAQRPPEKPDGEQRRVLSAAGEIVYTLRRKKVKNLNLRVGSDGSVAVSVPVRCPLKRADEFVAAKGAFILRAKEQFRRTAPPERSAYVSGGELTLLGERLRIQVSPGSPSAERRGGTLLLTLPDPSDTEAAARLTESFLSRLAKERFTQIMAEQYTRLRQGFDVAMPQLRIREMKTRWGFCLPQKGVVTLNRQLIFQPLPCVEYVALHELCHLVVPNHSPDFYATVARWMPDWRERRAMLSGRTPRVPPPDTTSAPRQ